MPSSTAWDSIVRLLFLGLVVKSTLASSIETFEEETSTKKFLVMHPALFAPAQVKDTRPIEVVRHLTGAGYDVDLMFWRNFAVETNPGYDDTNDRQFLMDSGVSNIMGPFDGASQALGKQLLEKSSDLDKYDGVLSWVLPDEEWMDALIEMIDAVKRLNGQSRTLSIVDDAAFTARALWESMEESSRSITTLDDVEKYLISKRQTHLLGVNDIPSTPSPLDANLFDENTLSEAIVMKEKEQYLYTISDMVVGVDRNSYDILKQLVPGTPSDILRFPRMGESDSSSEQIPFEERHGLVYFGSDKVENSKAIDWFVHEVLPGIHLDEAEDSLSKLHIAGEVDIPEVCHCDDIDDSCHSLHPLVVCHGELSNADLESLVRSSLVAINPALSMSGVVSKTAKALSYGTPVVITDNDGTFAGKSKASISTMAVQCSMKGEDVALCLAKGVSSFLTNEEVWNAASNLSEKFFKNVYLEEEQENNDDLEYIIDSLLEEKFSVVISGNAIKGSPNALAAQNWKLAKELNEIGSTSFHVSVLAEKFIPPIPGVEHKVPSLGASPFQTGFQADVVVQQRIPIHSAAHPTSYCGSGCRVSRFFTGEFGSFPEKLVNLLKQSADMMWAFSEYDTESFKSYNFDPAQSLVVPDVDTLAKAIESVVQGPMRRQVTNENVVLAGLIRRGEKMSPQTLEFTTSMSCVHNVRISIVGGGRLDILNNMYETQMKEKYPGLQCAPIDFVAEPAEFKLVKHRVDRIEILRNFQKSRIEGLLGRVSNLDRATVILADMDLEGLPSVDKVNQLATEIGDGRTDVDVLCSNGMVDKHYPAYYDTFATVLLPDTFVQPLVSRQIKEAWPDENQSLIVGDNFNQLDLFGWFQDQGQGADGVVNPVPVRSCFGGLSIVRASKFLDRRCSYTIDKDSISNAKYRDDEDGQACEHVVWNNCMKRVDPKISVAVQPDMYTIWKRSEEEIEDYVLLEEGKAAEGRRETLEIASNLTRIADGNETLLSRTFADGNRTRHLQTDIASNLTRIADGNETLLSRTFADGNRTRHLQFNGGKGLRGNTRHLDLASNLTRIADGNETLLSRTFADGNRTRHLQTDIASNLTRIADGNETLLSRTFADGNRTRHLQFNGGKGLRGNKRHLEIASNLTRIADGNETLLSRTFADGNRTRHLQLNGGNDAPASNLGGQKSSFESPRASRTSEQAEMKQRDVLGVQS